MLAEKLQTSANTISMLTVDEFADVMQVSRTTIFAWLREKKLVAGRHFIKIGAIIRFPLQASIDALLEDSWQNELESALEVIHDSCSRDSADDGRVPKQQGSGSTKLKIVEAPPQRPRKSSSPETGAAPSLFRKKQECAQQSSRRGGSPIDPEFMNKFLK